MGAPTTSVFGSRLVAYVRVVRTLMHRLLKRTDSKKWKQYYFPPEWRLRSRQIAAFVPPGCTVYEFGAGESNLGKFLPETCALFSSDVIERRPGMQVIDLNLRPFPSICASAPMVAVFGGVLEYLTDLPAVIQWASSNFEFCIASYECASENPGTLDWLRTRLRRAHEGWVNHYTQIQLCTLFANAGYQLVQTAVWGESDPGWIYVFQRSPVQNLRQIGMTIASAHTNQHERQTHEQ